MSQYFVKQVEVEEYPNGLILPWKAIDNGPMWGLGGVCDENNAFLPSCCYDSGWVSHGGAYSWAKEDCIDADAVYIGIYFHHWGHLLIDLCNRYWALPRICAENPGIKVAYLGLDEPKGNALRFLELLGVKKEQLFHVTNPTRFRKVYLPQQGAMPCKWYSDAYLQMFNTMVDNALADTSAFTELQGIEKVYFTRTHFGKAKRSEFGEAFFEEAFSNNGYQIFAPEKLTLDEQIYLWNHASHIACINGSIPLNVIFCKITKPNLTILNKTRLPHVNALFYMALRDVCAEFVDAYSEPIKGYPKSIGAGPFLLWPTENFSSFCNTHNFTLCAQDDAQRYFRKERLMYFLRLLNVKDQVLQGLTRLIPRNVKNCIREIQKKLRR